VQTVWFPAFEHYGRRPFVSAQEEQRDSIESSAPSQTGGDNPQKEDELQRSVEDARVLRDLAELVHEGRTEEIFRRVTEAAMRLGRSQYASTQAIEPDGSGGEHLRLLAFRGFNPRAARFWEIVTPDGKSACSICMKTGARVVVTDVETSDLMAGSEDRETLLQTGIRAVQTTPITARDGKLIGMISTHWDRPHQPTTLELSNFDVLARQTAYLLARNGGDEQRKLSKLAESYKEAEGAYERAASAVSRRMQQGVAPTMKELQRQRDAWVVLQAARRAFEEARDRISC
jgi:GAF domain-containing protein